MVKPRPEGEVTRLLRDWAAGHEEALEELFPLVLEELRRTARAYLARENRNLSLQPTELIDEVCMKLLGQRRLRWDNRRQFFAFSAQLMRRILVDSARYRDAGKRKAVKVPFSEAFGVPEGSAPDVLAVHEALEELKALDPRQAQIVEMRVFGGWTVDEIARALEIGTTTVKRDWNTALLWLRRELSRG